MSKPKSASGQNVGCGLIGASGVAYKRQKKGRDPKRGATKHRRQLLEGVGETNSMTGQDGVPKKKRGLSHKKTG